MSNPLPAARLLMFCRLGARPDVLCLHCKSDGVKGIDIGPDLRTVTVHCSECGELSAITISELAG